MRTVNKKNWCLQKALLIGYFSSQNANILALFYFIFDRILWRQRCELLWWIFHSLLRKTTKIFCDKFLEILFCSRAWWSRSLLSEGLEEASEQNMSDDEREVDVESDDEGNYGRQDGSRWESVFAWPSATSIKFMNHAGYDTSDTRIDQEKGLLIMILHAETQSWSSAEALQTIEWNSLPHEFSQCYFFQRQCQWQESASQCSGAEAPWSH